MGLYKAVVLFFSWMPIVPIPSQAITIPIWSQTGRILVNKPLATTIATNIAVLVDLFAEGQDFSRATIERNRNLYHQRQTAHAVSQEMNTLITQLTQSLQIHLNMGQSFVVNSSSTILALETVSSLAALSNKQINLTGDARLSIPSQLVIGSASRSTSVRYSIRVSELIGDG
jgi:hypothetical protein